MSTSPTTVITAGLIFLAPLFFLPFTINFFVVNKLLIIIIALTALLTHLVWTQATTRQHLHRPTPLTWPLVILLLVVAGELFLTQEAVVESLVDRGALFLLLPIITYLIAATPKSTRLARWSLIALVSTGTALALHSIAQLAILTNLTSLPIWIQNLNFSPTGSPLTTLITLTVTLIATLAWAVRIQNLNPKTALFATAGVQLAAIVAYLFLIFTQQTIVLQLLPLTAGWSLTLDALKSGHTMLVGVGLANFPVLFAQLKPAFLAQGDYWLTIFSTNTSEVLHLITTTGLIGFTAFGLLTTVAVKLTLKLEKAPLTQALTMAMYTLLASFIILPANFVTYILFFTLLGVLANQLPDSKIKVVKISPPYLAGVSTSVIVLIISVLSYFFYRFYTAEVAMFQAQQAYAANNAADVYQAHVKAINLMPRLANYRLSFAQINLQIASVMSQQESMPADGGQPTELTDQQRQQITTLVQRSIEQGQLATQLRPSYFLTWQNLGNTYRNLINVAQGADSFALQNLERAVTLNPNDANLRVEYGGLLYQLAFLVQTQAQQASTQPTTLNQPAQTASTTTTQVSPTPTDSTQPTPEEIAADLLEQATTQFRTAVRLNPNYANGYYNLSKTLEAQGNYRTAYQALQLALVKIDPASEDYQRAQQELLTLEAKLPQTKTQDNQAITESTPDNAQTRLQSPTSLPSPLPGGLLDLDQQSPELNQELPKSSSKPNSETTAPQPNETELKNLKTENEAEQPEQPDSNPSATASPNI